MVTFKNFELAASFWLFVNGMLVGFLAWVAWSDRRAERRYRDDVARWELELAEDPA